ncbi:hypothetical protein llap_15664 [Limosa lapponica baueri]|uniref:EF-hand domain-containing protein n=1 Tax=Limosa lapponica baueri TaxID=1758121 RepID=A0A2I0TJU5_LIMLA|nr:hypothetical protein llap_15664 [Limosa lapponica baueri]
MADYSRLKSILLDLQAHRRSPPSSPAEDRASQKRLLVEDMFKHLDINSDGHLSSSELAQLMKKEDLEDDLLDCTLEDLLRFDDYNNDGRLTLQELYTAFRLAMSSSFSSGRGQSPMSLSSPEQTEMQKYRNGTTHEKTCKFTHSCATNFLLGMSTSALVPSVVVGGDVKITVGLCESELGVASSAVSKNGAFSYQIINLREL